jgi:hypothetical protein
MYLKANDTFYLSEPNPFGLKCPHYLRKIPISKGDILEVDFDKHKSSVFTINNTNSSAGDYTVVLEQLLHYEYVKEITKGTPLYTKVHRESQLKKIGV